MKKRSISKKMLVGVFAVLIACTLVASAGLLTYYGQVTTEATVQQSVQLRNVGGSWRNWDNPILKSFTTTGGDCEVEDFEIRNQASIEAEIGIDTSFNTYGKGSDGVTVTYWTPEVYSYQKNIPGKDGDSPTINVKVEDTGDGWLKWTYTGDDTTRTTPKMTVAIDYPNGFAITTFDDGIHDGWYYAPDPDVESSRVRLGDYAGYDGETTGYAWVKTTKIGNVMTVSILKSHLGDSFKWHGYANFYNGACWINPIEDGKWHADLFNVNFWQPLTTPFTLQPGEELPFRIQYCFDIAIIPGQYDITSKFVPQ
jgi:hypothetical protein